MRSLAGFCLGMALAAAAVAQTPFDGHDAASDATLDAARGGFEVGGLQASFGLQQSTFINGRQVAGSAIEVADVRNLTSAQALALQAALGARTVVQNGAGNSVDAAAGAGMAAATLIQNSLSDQVIRNLTVLNVSTNGLQFLKAANAEAALRDALAAPVLTR